MMQQDVIKLREDEPHRAIPVLFVAGAGRSGSTLLDRMVGMHDGFCSTGELCSIWERSFAENQLCGCGARFDECAFWGEVSRAGFGMEPSQVDATIAIRLKRSLDENKYIPWLIQSHRPACYQSALLVYGELLKRLYSTVLDVSGKRVVIDSSGNAAHGLILSRVPGIELHVVHLIRDPRAVAFSWTRARRRPEIHWTSQNMPIENARTSARRWMMQNTLAELISRSAASYCRLRYEDFVADPDAALLRILSPYEWMKDQPTSLVGKEVVLAPAHTVSGNPMRFNDGPVKIGLDDEWRDAMRPSDRRAVVAITWPLATRYGYHARNSA